jgi:hypothetical protein
MDTTEVVILVLSLALIAFISYRLYRKIRIVRSGSPRSLTIQRSQTISHKPKTEPEKPTVIGMINCEYCGSLMPQTVLICPNCGASRRK